MIPQTEAMNHLEVPNQRKHCTDAEKEVSESAATSCCWGITVLPFYGRFAGWTALERNFSRVVVVILVYQLHIFCFFHNDSTAEINENTPKSAPFSSVFAPGIDLDSVDTYGHNWIPIYDKDIQQCTNLDSLIKSKGNVTPEESVRWEQLNCPSHLKGLYERWLNTSRESIGPCQELREDFGIIPGINWGKADADAKSRWKFLGCDCHHTTAWKPTCLHGSPPSLHKSSCPEGIENAVASRRPSERLRTGAGGFTAAAADGGRLPIIAVVFGTTSRGFRWSNLSQTPLCQFVLPSMPDTVEAGFEYRVYAGYDMGDLFFDNAERRAEIHAWFAERVAAPTAARGIEVQLALVEFLNVLHKPGPIFNFLSASAFEDGADYVYRVNDDTEFRSPWAGALVTTLQLFDPPFLGVVGPYCPEGNSRILTHDFVHRTHRNIFKVHYPVLLSDWWMDDWITTVYSSTNTRRLSNVVVRHHTWSTAGVRYNVNHVHRQFLSEELFYGADLIRAFRESHCAKSSCQLPDGHTTPLWSNSHQELKPPPHHDALIASRGSGSSLSSSSSSTMHDDSNGQRADGSDKQADNNKADGKSADGGGGSSKNSSTLVRASTVADEAADVVVGQRGGVPPPTKMLTLPEPGSSLVSSSSQPPSAPENGVPLGLHAVADAGGDGRDGKTEQEHLEATVLQLHERAKEEIQGKSQLLWRAEVEGGVLDHSNSKQTLATASGREEHVLQSIAELETDIARIQEMFMKKAKEGEAVQIAQGRT